jgi:hypothetical protein
MRHSAACDVSFPLRGRLRRTSALCRDGRVSLFGEGSRSGTTNAIFVPGRRSLCACPQTVPSDAGRKVQKDLEIQEYTDPHHDPMIPHTLVLKPGLIIHSLYNGYWYWGRPSIDDLRRDLREVTREIRPDWELAAPGLREAWDAGDRSMHHRYKET